MPVGVDENARVRRWRHDRLEAAGFSEPAAFRIALRLDVDYRRAIHLRDLGMSEDQITDELIDDWEEAT